MQNCFHILSIFALLLQLASANQSFSTKSYLYVSGNVQRMGIGQTQWSLMRKGDVLRAGDRVKVYEGGLIKLTMGDGLVVNVHENALFWVDRMLLDSSSLLLAWSVHYGQYWVQMESPLDPQYRQQVVLQGKPFQIQTSLASFFARFEENFSESSVHVVKGVLNVQGAKNEDAWTIPAEEKRTYTLKDSLWSHGALNIPLLLLDYPWLDTATLTKELAKGWQMTKRKADVLTGHSLARILVTDFNLENVSVKQWEVEKTLADFLAREFREFSYREVVRGGEWESSIQALGKEYEADRVVKGDLRTFEVEKKAVYSKKQKKWITTYGFYFSLELSVWDGVTGKEIRRKSYDARMEPNADAPLNYSELTSQPTLDLDSPVIKDSPVGLVINALKKQMKKFGTYAL